MIQPKGNYEAKLKACGLFFIGALFVLGLAQSAQAQTCSPLGYAGDCNLLITVNSNGTTTSTNPSPNAYDGIEDQYVGVLNNDPNLVVNSINLSGIGIFQFDSDGAFSGGTNCTFDGVAGTYPCGSGGGNTGGPGDNGYASAGVNFSNITLGTPNTGTVLFLNGGLAYGQLGLFSLEEPATPGAVSTTGINMATTPEPAAAVLWLTGIVLIFLRKAVLN